MAWQTNGTSRCGIAAAASALSRQRAPLRERRPIRETMALAGLPKVSNPKPGERHDTSAARPGATRASEPNRDVVHVASSGKSFATASGSTAL
jgi:hypothetical protein